MLVPVLFLFSLFFFPFFRARKREKRRGKAHTRMIGRVVKVTLIAPTVIVIFVIGIDYSFRFCFILSHNIFVCLFVLVWRSHIYIYISFRITFPYPIVSGFSIHFGQKYRIFKHVVVVVSLSEAID